METIGINGCIAPIARSPLDSARGRRISRGFIHNHSQQNKKTSHIQTDTDLEEFYEVIHIIDTITSLQTHRNKSSKGIAHK